ncbi:MAG: MGMT family protein [Patescibacteria group bacterium]
MKAMTFKDRVYKVVSRIPKGKTLTYGEVAELAGSPGAFRAVGNIMSKNWDLKIPCHRVVRADGKPGGYNRGRGNKVRILKKEGAI